jgi:SPP1 family predicted phage head-tail adaptor
MRAGALDQRVTIQSKTATRDAYGAEVITWSDVATVWMEAEPLSGREYIAMRQTQSDVTTRFRCRYRAGITTAMRLVWRTQPFNITEVIDRNGRRAELEILAFAEAVAT